MVARRIFIFWFLLLTACAGETPEQLSLYEKPCASGIAHLGVTDGNLRILCGCAEPAGTVVDPPDKLTCTIPAGTVVVIQYFSTAVRHQIVPLGMPDFPASPLLRTRSHSFKLDVPGTYAFQDAVNNAMRGDFIVQ